MAIINPSLREKSRYILLKDLDSSFFKLFKDKYIEFFGKFGLAKAGVMFLQKDKFIVLKVNRKYLANSLFVLYTLKYNSNIVGIFRTLKEIETYIKENSILT